MSGKRKKQKSTNKGEKMYGASDKKESNDAELSKQPDNNEGRNIVNDVIDSVVNQESDNLKTSDPSTSKDSNKQALEGGGLQEATSDDDEVNDSSKTQVLGDIEEFKPDGNLSVTPSSENSDGDVATNSTPNVKKHEPSPPTSRDDSSDESEHQSEIEVEQEDGDKSITDAVDSKELNKIEETDSDKNIGSGENRQSVESNGGENFEVSSTGISKEEQPDDANLSSNDEKLISTSSTPYRSGRLLRREIIKQNKLTGKNFSDGASKDSISLNPNKRVILCITKITTVVLGAVFIASLISSLLGKPLCPDQKGNLISLITLGAITSILGIATLALFRSYGSKGYEPLKNVGVSPINTESLKV